MKTRIIYIALTAVLSLSTISVFADGTKGKKDSSQKKSTTVAAFLNSAKEVGMELESWMTSLKEFNNKTEVFVESPLEFESWMLNDFSNAISAEEFQDEELVLESWMMEDFKVNMNEDFQEDELILEEWMLESFEIQNQEIFIDEELEFESWMLEIM